MFGKFLPRTESFFDDFDKHSVLVVRCSQELLEMIMSGGSNLNAFAERITIIEKQADGIARHCIETLHKTFITPFERDDIFRLITRMDDIIDIIEDISVRIVLFKLVNMTPEAKELSNIIASSAQLVAKSVQGLRKLENIPELVNTLQRIRECEHQADQLLRRAISELFDNGTDPITIIKWKEIYEMLEEATDSCQVVANIAEGVIIEHS